MDSGEWLPEPVRDWFADDPRRLFLVTVPLIVWCGVQFLRAAQLHAAAGVIVAQHRSDAARAASEALGG